jgi:SAM-dependent methyltransferase
VNGTPPDHGHAQRIAEIQAFWDANPLWTGDAQSAGSPGSREFFDSHTRAVLRESGGRMDERFYPTCDRHAPVLDLGCGIGFWLEEYGRRGFTDLTGADLSQQSLALARRRCELNGITAKYSIQNAQMMSLPDESFEHVVCTGVVHHSPDPRSAIAEMFRVLRPGGRAVVGVYYMNVPLRYWRWIRPVGRLAMRLGFTPKGRGRDDMMTAATASELVRRYDGAANPWGQAFTRRSFTALFDQRWQGLDIFGYGFPARLLPRELPRPVFKGLEWGCPFLIAAVATKRGHPR